ncbi:MAG: hypothetical protein QXO96_02670, partial [Sulfolobales archaeon]
MRVVSSKLCVRCKGYKYLCGLSACPIIIRFRSMMDAISNVKNRDIISGSTPPSIIVGEKGYPKVNIIFNLPPNIYGDSAKEYENPQGWWGRKSLGDIIKLRSYMVSSIIKNINVNDPLTLY